VRALDLTRVLAGPTCGKCLAEHGAEVLKISAEHLPDSGLVEMDTGIGKRSARLDLRSGDGRGKLEQLVKQADVFVQSYRPGTLAARGFSPERLAELKPGIVCTSLSAWGTTGPWRTRRGFDSIVQAVSGMAHKSGDEKSPKLLPVSAIDYTSGYLMAFGTAVALERRAREGGSWLVRVALARIGRWIVDHGLTSFDGVAADVPAEEVAQYCAEMDAPVGRLTYLKPVIRFSHTPGEWTLPPVPLGTHEARWEQ
jgi:crotonobetainyl-CoA:carnitine CoA-transferase CaiB-like acyl-CoA transferase